MKYFLKSSTHRQWCAGQCLAASRKCGALIWARTDFCGVNTSIVTDLKVWICCHLAVIIPENLIIGSQTLADL